MGNLAYKVYRTEDLKKEFLNKGFTEEAVDFILLHNDNFSFEILKEKINSLEQQIMNVENNLKKDIEFTKIEFRRDISNLDIKIDNVEKNLQKDISNLDVKIDNVEKNLQKDISNLEKNLLKEMESNNAILREEMKNSHSILLEKLGVGNRMLTIITAIGIPIIISIIMSLISKFFVG
ncbi:DUF1640 domain-containing protein (plasmid) [Borrelia coriaceae]|uniref:BDR-repeat family protein n=1 Tax=Borrelia coriaceae ATCC 43381 TaxID=1408429 RepID=W5T2S0_9SPIR|nr:Bdr family repetitive protein [Borrelia coriaceae]AHH11621.1 BDR-repeat family protein [Borrelia coriaceae ATCC 43381]UPA17484.1 DUF1640 domain-containing protein [Borrelia coriaceae]